MTSTKRTFLISGTSDINCTSSIEDHKSFLRKACANKSFVIIDLEKNFNAHESSNRDFLSFIIHTVLKLNHSKEKSFNERYNNGEVIFIIDGIDYVQEIRKKFISDIIQTFLHTNGNQLWITTQSDLENLQKLLNIDGLVEFTEEQGVELVALKWTMDNSGDLVECASEYNKVKADRVCRKVMKLSNCSIVVPEFYKTIGNLFKDERNVKDARNIFNSIIVNFDKNDDSNNNSIGNTNNKIFNSCFFISIAIIVISIFAAYSPLYNKSYKYDSLSSEEQNLVRNTVIGYKNVLLRIQDLFDDNTEVYNQLTSEHISLILEDEAINFNNPEFDYLIKFVNLTWRNLNNDLKKKALNSEIIFQNENFKVKNLYKAYPKPFESLTSDEILKLLDKNPFKIGENVEYPSDSKLEQIVNSLPEKSLNEKVCSLDSILNYIKNVNEEYILVNNNELFDIKELLDTQNSRLFVVNLENLRGKLLGFDKLLVSNLNRKYPDHWIVYFNFLEHSKDLKMIDHFDNTEKLLFKILNLNSKSNFEKQIFLSFYKSNKVIFLWDNSDEIPTSHKEIALNLIQNIHKSTKNIQLVSSQLPCSENEVNALDYLSDQDQMKLKDAQG
ncbi:uncharacterized protein [Chironomus tepperi]|uniref:uncharacterized protein isoform X2 n=1 Tax=Chironomus tepperi TaxID=113505 RepID=UPI00391F18ED